MDANLLIAASLLPIPCFIAYEFIRTEITVKKVGGIVFISCPLLRIGGSFYQTKRKMEDGK